MNLMGSSPHNERHPSLGPEAFGDFPLPTTEGPLALDALGTLLQGWHALIGGR